MDSIGTRWRRAADAQGGGIRIVELRVFLFQFLQLAEELVVFRVGDFRRGLIVIELVVMADGFAQLADAGFRGIRLREGKEVRFVHGGGVFDGGGAFSGQPASDRG
jgi:hypothetical protein